MFSWFDIITPIGTAVLATVLCVLGIIKSDKLAPKLVSLITMMVFIAAVPLVYAVRYKSLKVDYTTTYGLGVIQGTLNKCEESVVQQWENELINFWVAFYPNVGTALDGKKLLCLDEEKINLSVAERFVRGYSTSTVAVIGWRDISYARSLFRHEVSHLILGAMGVPWDEKIQHDEMISYGLKD